MSWENGKDSNEVITVSLFNLLLEPEQEPETIHCTLSDLVQGRKSATIQKVLAGWKDLGKKNAQNQYPTAPLVSNPNSPGNTDLTRLKERTHESHRCQPTDNLSCDAKQNALPLLRLWTDDTKDVPGIISSEALKSAALSTASNEDTKQKLSQVDDNTRTPWDLSSQSFSFENMDKDSITKSCKETNATQSSSCNTESGLSSKSDRQTSPSVGAKMATGDAVKTWKVDAKVFVPGNLDGQNPKSNTEITTTHVKTKSWCLNAAPFVPAGQDKQLISGSWNLDVQPFTPDNLVTDISSEDAAGTTIWNQDIEPFIPHEPYDSAPSTIEQTGTEGWNPSAEIFTTRSSLSVVTEPTKLWNPSAQVFTPQISGSVSISSQTPLSPTSFFNVNAPQFVPTSDTTSKDPYDFSPDEYFEPQSSSCFSTGTVRSYASNNNLLSGNQSPLENTAAVETSASITDSERSTAFATNDVVFHQQPNYQMHLVVEEAQ
ncbi:hypothetical protein DFQ30_004934 [Apophysomyces sp. BC1015]|nr:hypothetical protein DFQ30_004934 [Apophysomyces sp. BC1015]